MRKSEEKISADSLWITATPIEFTKTLPFYILEAGHFRAEADYCVRREIHDSFLLLYTIKGKGAVRSESCEFLLPPGFAAVIDCRTPHEYYSISESWEFLWIHFNGSGIEPLFHITYPSRSLHEINMEDTLRFEHQMLQILDAAKQNTIASHIQISSELHSILNKMSLASLQHAAADIRHKSDWDIQAAVSYIEKNYGNSVSLEDIIRDLPVSKYHFIRRFKAETGATPYSYLTNYRIHMSKKLLRSTGLTVSEIAESCGFPDTSNFIVQFKKHTGQKPLQYWNYFSAR